MDEVWVTIRSLNQYIEDVKPWNIAKVRETDNDAESHLSEVLAYCVGTLNQIAHLLAPFLPSTAAAILGLFEGGVVREPGKILFPKIYNHTTDPRAPKA
jgi:methionyl-tRNA synthetase